MKFECSCLLKNAQHQEAIIWEAIARRGYVGSYQQSRWCHDCFVSSNKRMQQWKFIKSVSSGFESAREMAVLMYKTFNRVE